MFFFFTKIAINLNNQKKYVHKFVRSHVNIYKKKKKTHTITIHTVKVRGDFVLLLFNLHVIKKKKKKGSYTVNSKVNIFPTILMVICLHKSPDCVKKMVKFKDFVKNYVILEFCLKIPGSIIILFIRPRLFRF